MKKRIRKYLRDARTRSFWRRFISMIACIVVFCTTYALLLPAITMEKTAACGFEEHQHVEECFEEKLTCGLEEGGEHTHTADCYSTEKHLVCKENEHVHNGDCYDKEGRLTCALEEHSHNGGCYEMDRILSCGQEETKGHTHTAACYEKILTCGKQVHSHSPACYKQETADTGREESAESQTKDSGRKDDPSESRELEEKTGPKTAGIEATEFLYTEEAGQEEAGQEIAMSDFLTPETSVWFRPAEADDYGWNRVDGHAEILQTDDIRLYYQYTIPAGTLDPDHPETRLALPENITLTDNQIEYINTAGDERGAQVINGARLPNAAPQDEETVAAWFRIENHLDENENTDGMDSAGKTDFDIPAAENGSAFDAPVTDNETTFGDPATDNETTFGGPAMDIVLTFDDSVIEENRDHYEDGRLTRAGRDVSGFFSIDLSVDQIDFEKDTKEARILLVPADAAAGTEENSAVLAMMDENGDSGTEGTEETDPEGDTFQETDDFKEAEDFRETDNFQKADDFREADNFQETEDSQEEDTFQEDIVAEEQTESAEEEHADTGDETVTEEDQAEPGDEASPEEEQAESGDEASPEEDQAETFLSTLTFEGDDYTVTATFDQSAGIPAGSALSVKEITQKEKDYQNYREQAEQAVGGNPEETVAWVRLFDISIVKDGQVVEPSGPVSVQINYHEAMKRASNADVKTVHFEGEKETPRVLDTETEGTATAVEQVTFDTESFSVFAIVGTTIEKTVLASDGHNYRITATYGLETGIPKDADLAVEEILPSGQDSADKSAVYDAYVSKTENALGIKEGGAGYMRLFDISIADKNDHNVKYQPAEGTSVDVCITLADSKNEQLSVVHFSDANDKGSIINTEIDGQAVSFEAGGFSVYAIVGTDETAHKVRVKYVFQDTEGNPFMFLNEAGESVDNQIIKNGESIENVGLPKLNAEDQTFNGWYIYDTVNDNFTGYQITFDKPISISDGAQVTSVTGDKVEISDADNTAVSDPSNPDYTVYVRPFCGEVRYITFWNEVDGKIVYTKIQVPKDAEYNIETQSAIPPDAIINDDGEVEYVSYAFEGWAVEPGTLEKPGHPDERTAVADTVITVSEDCEFYPIYRLAHWISFNTAPTGSGATYYAPVYVRSGESASGARPAQTPVWPGHTFVGWFEEEDDDYLSVGETANGTFNFNQVIDEDKVLYAHWNAGTANVTVIRWLQSVTDHKDYTNAQKTYEYGGQENIIRNVNTAVYSNAFNDVAGFNINSARSDRSVIVKEDGTAELNIYYDRKTIQMIFNGLGNKPGEYYTETTSNTGIQYGLVDGSYVQLTRGTIPVTTWSYKEFIENTDSVNNVYGLVNGEYVSITRGGTVYSADGITEYTGQRYSRYWDWGWEYYPDSNGTYYPYTNWYGGTSYAELRTIYTWKVIEDNDTYTGTRYTRRNRDTSYDGNRFIRSGDNYKNYIYTRTESTSGTQYGTDVRGGHVQLTPTTTDQQVWYYDDINGERHIYEDTRYTKTTENNTTVYTGLYGQTLEQNGYTWPQGVWQYSGGGMSYLGQFVLPDDISGNTIRFTSNGTAGKRFYYFLQNVDGTYNTIYTDIGYGTSNVGTFNFTEKYDGFTVDSYQRENTGNGTTGNWTTTSNGLSVSMSGYTSLGVRYRRLSYDIKFLDSRNGTELSDVQAKTLVYGANLSNADPDVTEITPPTSQYVWDGHWYTDQECTEIALFHDDLTTEGELGEYTSIDTVSKTVTYGTGDNAKTYHYHILDKMPNHDIAVYAGWNEIWYWVKIDPDGGVLTDTESTWFWKTLGDKIEEYHDVTRRYVEDPNGVWYYHYDELDPETELNQYGTNERKAYYTLDPALSSDGGKTYSEDNKAYSLVGWYEVDQESGQLKGLYNFDGGVTGNTILRAVWRTVGEYKVKYSTEAVDAAGKPLYADPDDEETRIDTGNGTAPIDNSVYADKSNSAIARGPSSNPENYVFMGWYYDGMVYGPGDAFMIKAEHANADKEIWLYPVYVRYEDLPVTVTHVHWYANYNDRLGNQINDRTDDNQSSDDTTNDPLQLNVAIDIMNIDELLNGSTAYAGYKFLGWAKTQGANEPWLKLEDDGTYSMKDGTETVTGITKIAADELLPYDDMYAVWEPKPYTVTVIKSVDSVISTDKQHPFTFTPRFSATGLPAGYQNNFSLTGEETTVSPAEGDEITYHTQKIFENVPYGSNFSFTEGNYADFELKNVKYTVTDAEDTTKNVTDRLSSNGASITVYGNVTVTFTNKPKHKSVKIYKVDDSETPVALDGVGFTLGENNLTTGTDGYTRTVALTAGEYSLTETAPKEHYTGLSTPVTISVDGTGVTVPSETENVTVSEPDEDGLYTITVVNPRKRHTVTVIKNVTGTDTDKDAQYEFTASGLRETSDTFSLYGRHKEAADESPEQKNTKIYSEVPYGTEFSITEAGTYTDFDTDITAVCVDSDGNTKTITLDSERINKLSTGTIKVEGDLTITYTNKRNKQPVAVYKTGIGENETITTGATFVVYKASEYNDDTQTANAGATIVAQGTTNENGILLLGSLPIESGKAYTEYRLVETAAPAGYNLPEEAMKLFVYPDRIYGMQGTGNMHIRSADEYTDITDKSTVVLRVWNNPGVVLPSTGGPGTTLIHILGLLLTGLAGIGLLLKRNGHKRNA